MKEFPFVIDKSFVNGLRPEDTFFEKQSFLEECINVKPSPAGLIAYERPTRVGLATAFPYPQMWIPSDADPDGALFFYETSIREGDYLGAPTNDWVTSLVDLYDPTLPNTTTGLTGGGVWHIVDLWPAFYAFNGVDMVFRTGLANLAGETGKTYATTDVGINTGCTNKGRIFVGGLTSTWSDLWTSIFAEWEQGIDAQEFEHSAAGPGKNWVMWSSIGGGDFPLWLIYPQGFGDLGLGPSREEILSRLKRNELGWAPMPFSGEVLILRPLGDSVIAYGTNGICALLPRGADIGFRKIANFGITGRGDVGGSLSEHIFVDGNGQLWSLSDSLNLSKLGYSEYLSLLSSDTTVVSYNEAEREYYLCSPEKAFVYIPEQGMAEINDRICDGAYWPGSYLARTYLAAYTSGTTTGIRVTTGPFDNDRRALKYVHDVQVHYQDITNLAITLLFRYDASGAYQSLGPTRVNREGIVTFTCTALEYKIRLTGTLGTNPRIHRIETRWSLVDKRAVRGLFGSENQ